jgi:DNA-binding beta-propeller fold protein YncE
MTRLALPRICKGWLRFSSPTSLPLAVAFVSALLLGTPAHATLNNGESATHVLGQAGFTTSTAATTQSGMRGPETGVLDFVNHRLFVVDDGNNRVLVYNLNTDNSITGDGMNASNVLGQSTFTSGSVGTTQSTMKCPISVTLDSVNNWAFVTDYCNNRVLVFNTTSITNGMNASFVLGQPDFTSAGSATSQSGMNGPNGIALDPANNRLFVADLSNNRVLVFNTAPRNGLLAWWKFDESSGTMAADSSGNGNTGTLTASNASFATGRSNNAVTLTHTGTTSAGLVNIAPANFAFQYNQPFTVTAWIYRTSNTEEDDIFGKEDPSNNYRGYSMWLTDATPGNSVNSCPDGTSCLIAEVQNSEGGTDLGIILVSPSNVVSTGVWHHVAMTYDGSHTAAGTSVYVDGNALTTTAYQDTLGTHTILNSRNFQIGGDGDGDGSFDSGCCTFSGEIDDVRVYNRALSASEIAAIYFTGINAANVLGQANFTSSGSATTQSGMGTPCDVAFDPVNNRLFVEDAGNERILVFNTGTITNGMNASYVLGQTNFTSSGTGTSQSAMHPGIAGDCGKLSFDSLNHRLFLADQGNNRVLIFDTANISNGMNASRVLGQADFTSSGTATTQSGLKQPDAVMYDPATHNVFVGDTQNNRITIFDGSYLGGSQWTPGYD